MTPQERQKARAEKTGRLPEWYLENFRHMRVPCAHTIIKYKEDDIEPTLYCAVTGYNCTFFPGAEVCMDAAWGCEDYAPMLACAYCALGGNNQWHSSLKTHCALIGLPRGEPMKELEDQNSLSPCGDFSRRSIYGTYVDFQKVLRLHLRAIYKEAWEKKEHYGFIDENYLPPDD